MRRRYWLLTLALIAPMAFAGAHPAQRFSGQDDADPALRKKIGDDFASALLVAKDNYAGQTDLEKLTTASINGMLHTLDPHSSYFDRKAWEEFQNEQLSRYSGIGSFINQRNGKVFIISPFQGTPAWRGDVRYGDQIIGIDGKSTEGWTSRQVSDKLIGPEGTQVTVKFLRLGTPQPIERKFGRESVPLNSISNYAMVGNGVGYINLDRAWQTTTAQEMQRAVEDLQKQGLTSLILDLRKNGGGLVEQAKKVANMFLYRGQKIVSLRGRPGVFPTRESVAERTNPEEFPLVLLIDRGTASASEIVAGALQDHDRAVIVGENSFGKGLVQNVFPLSDGSGMILTAGHFYTPSGRLIQRDYANRSFYDYYLKRGDQGPAQHTEQKHTDSGRPVYGGGGIDPDVAVKISAREFELQRVWIDPVFEFARYLVAGQIPGFSEFKVDHTADHNHRLGQNDYLINDKILGAFKDFLREHKDIKADVARIDKDAEWLKIQIRYEVVTSAYGLDVARQVLLADDAQFQRGLAELPRAKAQMDDIRKLRASSRGGDARRN